MTSKITLSTNATLFDRELDKPVFISENWTDQYDADLTRFVPPHQRANMGRNRVKGWRPCRQFIATNDQRRIRTRAAAYSPSLPSDDFNKWKKRFAAERARLIEARTRRG